MGKKNWKSIVVRVLVVLFVLWLAGSAFLVYAMSQPPERFGHIMKHVPIAAFIVLPFETIWTRERAGQLNVGSSAPDFDLEKLDKSGRVQLGSFRGQKPVVLVFGSYT